MSARPVIRNLAQLDDYGTLSDAVAGTPSLRTLGTAATQAAAGNHGHAASAITSGVLAMARLATGTPDGTKFVRDDGTLAVPAGGLSQGTADTLYAGLAPATAARNTIQATADIVPLTLKSRTASPPANLRVQEWQTSAGVVYGAISDVGAANLGGTTRTLKRAFFKSSTAELSVALTAEKAPGAASAIDIFTDTVIAAQGGYNADGAALRVFNIDSDRGTGSQGARGQEPATWIAQDGAIMTHKYMVISGTTAGALDTWQLQPPSAENSMLAVWCDTPDACIVTRPSGTGSSYNLGCFDATSANYRFTIERDGMLKWGDHATHAAMDVTLARDTSGWGGLATNGHLLLNNNKRILAKNAGGTYESIFFFDNGNVLQLSAFDSTVARTQVCGPFRVLQGTTPYAIAFDITASQIIHGFDLAIDAGKNIVLATTTGTKIGTGATQKLGFWGVTPVIQPAAYTQTYATATRTNANPTAVTLTDNSGGTANTTLELIAGAVYATDAPGIKNNFADLAAAVNALVVDVANNKQIINSLVDDHQAVGLAS